MRITSSVLINNFLRNLNANIRSLDASQNRLSSGKRVTRPSDDPVALAHSLRLRSNLAGLEQYQKNVQDALSWLEVTDTALASATELLHRAKELAVYGAGGSLDGQALAALSEEVKQLSAEMQQVANTNFAGSYIFGGNKTQTPPYTADGVYQGSSIERQTEIGVAVIMPYSLTGDKVFGHNNILEMMSALQSALAGTGFQKTEDLIGDLDTALSHLLTMRAETGARTNRLQLAMNRLQDNEFNLTALLSETEDIDIATTIVNLKTQENIYRASLAAGARVIQPSLLEFLR